MFKKKGIFLIYVLITAILISIFLIGAVENMHNSFFLSNKFTGENKAYWAAEAGLQYCEYKLKSDLSWPFNSTNKETKEIFGKFTINCKSENSGNGYSIHGLSDDEDEEFCLYFSKNLSKNSNDLTADIVPLAFPSEPKNLSFCSYNSIDEENLKKIFQKRTKLEYSQVSFKVSKSPEYKVVITTPGIYLISDGRSKGYRTVLEKMLVPDNSNTIGGGIYCGGNIKIGPSNNDATPIGMTPPEGIINPTYRFKVSQTSNSRANIYCKKNIVVNRKKEINHFGPTPKLSNEVFPFFIGDGTLYLNNSPFVFQINENRGNQYGSSSYPLLSNNGNTNNENDTIKQKYGINIEQYKKEFDNAFPKITYSDIQQMKTSDSPNEIQGGTYCAIKSEDDNNNYVFCYLPISFLDENYDIDENSLNTAMQTANNMNINNAPIQRLADNIDKIINNKHHYNRQGNLKQKYQEKLDNNTDELRNYLEEIEELYATSGSRIEQFAKENGGKIICGNIKVKEKGEFKTKTFTNSNFSIKTVNINTITDINEKQKEENEKPGINLTYTTTETPIITIKKSIEVKDSTKGFTLLTLNLQSSPIDINIDSILDAVESGDSYDDQIPNPTFTYSIAHDVSTDLILDKKNTGLNEPYILREINRNSSNPDSEYNSELEDTAEENNNDGTNKDNEINKQNNNAVQTNNLIACQSVNLYSNGPVILYGKLSGTGQILSDKSVYFKAGTQLNANNYIKEVSDDVYEEKMNVGETSKIGIYSGRVIKMGAPEGEKDSNINELHRKIKYLLAGEKGKSIKEISNKILYTKINNKPITINKDDLGRFATERSSNSALTDNDLTQLSLSIAEDWKIPISLSKLMRKYYGFEDREAEDYIQETIERNCIYDENTKQYKMPDYQQNIEVMSRSSSSFSGILYACGGFKCDAENNNVVINGTIVTYGANPSTNSPGSGIGLDSLTSPDMLNISDYGNIEIYNCKDFSIVYDSTDFAAFVNKISDKPINLSGIYSNKLSL